MRGKRTIVLGIAILLLLSGCNPSDDFVGKWNLIGEKYSAPVHDNCEKSLEFLEGTKLIVQEETYQVALDYQVTEDKKLIVKTVSGTETTTYQLEGDTLTLRYPDHTCTYQKVE